ncbi:hypothetical protein N7493_002666 [Penicillium malachiteum]|uniref:Uncharacterized protein n=1 Tax=Penicillium malachiteum TaxID=1324776 RepID=A0AAD6HSN1_9EURO|nr:hypothetical protein N7493_002666 [Penicillium malachiteum]
MPQSRNQAMEDATFGLGAADVRCLLLVMLITKPELENAALASISGYSPKSARTVYCRAIANLRRAHQTVEQKSKGRT